MSRMPARADWTITHCHFCWRDSQCSSPVYHLLFFQVIFQITQVIHTAYMKWAFYSLQAVFYPVETQIGVQTVSEANHMGQEGRIGRRQ